MTGTVHAAVSSIPTNMRQLIQLTEDSDNDVDSDDDPLQRPGALLVSQLTSTSSRKRTRTATVQTLHPSSMSNMAEPVYRGEEGLDTVKRWFVVKS